ncbi:MAG: YbdK family carboxylate-amine ligase, partial [Burkholderiaceae bacterium]
TPLTLGVELELQIVDRREGDLTRGADDLIDLIEPHEHAGDIKPEITQSMIEVSTRVQTRYADLHTELVAMRDQLVAAADRLDLQICGGGAHPFQHWSERRIYDKPRFQEVAALYGYLAKQFTVFGQHVHIGCRDGDTAITLLHRMARYVPQFIALAACSPYYQGTDTGFDCSRLNTVFAFPLSGRAPFVTRWSDFEIYFDKMRSLGVVTSMKDFYWDIRPKPEYGTIEVRVFDTPLTVERAAVLGAYVQTLAAMLLEETTELSEDIYLSYSYNRFQACRFGLDGMVIDPMARGSLPLRVDIKATLERLRPFAQALGSGLALDQIESLVQGAGNHARWQRAHHQHSRSLTQLVHAQAQAWRCGQLAPVTQDDTVSRVA